MSQIEEEREIRPRKIKALLRTTGFYWKRIHRYINITEDEDTFILEYYSVI